MKEVTYECVVENGCVHLPTEAHIPEKATVYLVVPDLEERRTIHIRSPRSSDPSKADFFKLEATPEPPVAVPEPRKPGQSPPRIRSPRLAHPEQAADFVKEVYSEDDDA